MLSSASLLCTLSSMLMCSLMSSSVLSPSSWTLSKEELYTCLELRDFSFIKGDFECREDFEASETVLFLSPARLDCSEISFFVFLGIDFRLLSPMEDSERDDFVLISLPSLTDKSSAVFIELFASLSETLPRLTENNLLEP